ncbi:MAG: sigma-70 family RNA polymerase sigma factor [Clostridiales bacterium]|nr:MAG: sigma-70 family RNA polymerase sigma factor [Clostridiales bacterium]
MTNTFAPKTRTRAKKIIEKYMYLPKIITRKYLNKGVEYDDLFQVACVGLINAADRFDPNVGVEFQTFATPTILGEIKRYFRDKGHDYKASAEKFTRCFKKANRIRLKRMQYDRVYSTIDEIADVLKLGKNEIDNCMLYENIVNIISLDSPVYNGETPLLSSIVGFDENEFLLLENKDFIKSSIKLLTNEEKRLIIHRYYRNLTQKKLQKRWNVSQMYISRLERKTLEKA